MEISNARPEDKYEVCFNALAESWRSLAFPCDARGRVPIDSLTSMQKIDYLFARGMMGIRYAAPCVRSCGA